VNAELNGLAADDSSVRGDQAVARGDLPDSESFVEKEPMG
jgi:hypothetical protein